MAYETDQQKELNVTLIELEMLHQASFDVTVVVVLVFVFVVVVDLCLCW